VEVAAWAVVTRYGPYCCRCREHNLSLEALRETTISVALCLPGDTKVRLRYTDERPDTEGYCTPAIASDDPGREHRSSGPRYTLVVPENSN
jgi:hypothetical protein